MRAREKFGKTFHGDAPCDSTGCVLGRQSLGVCFGIVLLSGHANVAGQSPSSACADSVSGGRACSGRSLIRMDYARPIPRKTQGAPSRAVSLMALQVVGLRQ